jgi:hypothetical protein
VSLARRLRLLLRRQRVVDLLGAQRRRPRADPLPILLKGGALLDRAKWIFYREAPAAADKLLILLGRV